MIEAVREIRREDVEATCGLLSHLSVSFAGVVSGSLSRAICEDALRYEDPSILVASLDGELAGVVVAIESRGRRPHIPTEVWRRLEANLEDYRYFSGRIADCFATALLPTGEEG